MIDAQNGTFQLQARTNLAQGNSTTATIFAAGAAKEENTSIVEVRVKKGGKKWIKIPGYFYPQKIKMWLENFNTLERRQVAHSDHSNNGGTKHLIVTSP